MDRGGFSKYLSRSRRASVAAPIVTAITSFLIVALIAGNVHIASVIGTTAAATIAACATFTRSHFRTQKYVRFAIRARLATKAEPDFDKLTRQYRALGKYVQKSAHPSPEINDALREAEKRMGMRSGSVLALVVPLELILGVPYNCPAAASMLYAGRHPVILIDDQLQLMLDSVDDFEKSYKIVVSVLCHELAHLIGWNTRWSRSVGIGDLFVTTAAMASLVAYGLEQNLVFGLIGAVIAATHLASEPALVNENQRSSPLAIVARIALLMWVPYVLVGVAIGALPLGLTIGVTILSLGLRYILAMLRRREELYADAIAAVALGTSSPLTDFFRSLGTNHPNLWSQLFSTHPSIHTRIKSLRRTRT